MSPLQLACAVLVPFLWGCQFVVIKVGLTAFPPLFFVGLRFAVVAAILIPFVQRPTRREFERIAIVSVFMGGLNFSLIFIGLGLGSASITGIVFQMATPFTLLLSWPLLGERPSPRIVVGVALAFAGVVLTAIDPQASVKIVPALLVLGSALAMAAGNVLTKRYGPFEPLKLMAWMSLFTVPQLLVASMAFEHGQVSSLSSASLAAWAAFGYTVVIGAILGFGLWFWLIARCSMSRVAPFGLLQTLFAVVAGVVFLHEPLTARLLAGAAICIAGVAMTQGGSIVWPRPFRKWLRPAAP